LLQSLQSCLVKGTIRGKETAVIGERPPGSEVKAFARQVTDLPARFMQD